MHPVIKEWCYAREVLRRFGFGPDEIFFACAPSGIAVDPDGTVHHLDHPVIGLEVQRDGKTFMWTIGAIDMTVPEIQAAYEQACIAWNAGELGHHGDFISSRPARQSMAVMVALQRKGLLAPGVTA